MKKVFWYLLTVLVVMATVLASCQGQQPTTTKETPKTTTTTATTKTPPVTSTTTQPGPTREISADTSRSEKPQYGATVTLSLAADITGFDEAFVAHNLATTLHLTNEELLQGDWTKGPAGTKEADFVLGGINDLRFKTGALADTWSIPERGKMIFHIRQGVYWHNKPPTNGRELTVDDVVFSLKRMCTEAGSYIKMAYPNLAKTAVITGDNATRMVTIECPVSEWANAITLFPDFTSIMPRDAIEKFGNLNDWRNSIGTGAFIMTDFVSNGSVTFKKNTNYWERNPIGPGKGDQLPYIDGVKLLIIVDTATRMTAMRTAKIDGVGGEWDDVKDIIQNNPAIKSMLYVSDSCYNISMRTDKPESPFSKKEVRQALFYATNFDQIKNDYYGGKAVTLVWPLSPSKESIDAYVPLEKLPANVAGLYQYNPAKAKELLTAAGYPTGFKTTIVCYNTPTQTDYLALIQKMWAEVGITLTIDARDYATWLGRVRARNYDELIYSYNSGAWQKMINFTGPSQYNSSYVNDAKAIAAAAKVSDYIGMDEAGLAKLNADLMPYVLEQAWVLPKPNPYAYVIWWPWRKNWNGELQVGYYNYPSYLKYTWTDLALKKQMTGQ